MIFTVAIPVTIYALDNGIVTITDAVVNTSIVASVVAAVPEMSTAVADVITVTADIAVPITNVFFCNH